MNIKTRPRRRQLGFDDVRAIALSMPEVEEVTTYGMPGFKAGKTTFAVQPYPRPDVLPNSIGVPVSFEERARLLASRPDVYYLTDHFAKHPGVLVQLSTVTRTELRDILSAAWHYAMEKQAPASKARRKTSTRARTRR